MGAECEAGGAFLPAFYRVHLCRLAGFRGIQDLPEGWLWSSGRVCPPFCPPFRFVLGALSLNMALFRVFRAFLAGFMGFAWVCLAWRFLWLVWLFVRVWG